MTEQEITQARSDVDQLDIEQLRCGVLLQLLHIGQLKKECDTASLAAAGEIMEAAIVSRGEIDRLQYEVDAIPAIKAERDALTLAVDQWRVDYHELRLEHDTDLEQNTQLDARCAKLEAERDALAADARRYRFITAHIVDEGDMDALERAFESLGDSETCTQAEFDACIDVAIFKEARQAGVQ